MKGWKEVRIGDIFEIKASGDLQEANYSPCRTDHARWAIYANSLENKGLYGYTSQPRFRGNAVTITGRGEVGHAEFRDEDFDAIVRLLVLLPKVDVDCRYITYYINSFVHFPKESTGVPQLTAPKVKRIKINLPQLKAEQTAIANILSKVDEAITSVQNSIAAAERLKKSLMQNLLTGKMKPDGTFRTPEEFYIDEKLGKVPIGWEVKKLKDIAQIQRGKFGHRPRNDERFYNGDFPFVQTGDVVESVFFLKGASQSLNALGASVSRSFPVNTIIMTIAANIGFVALTRYEVFFPDSLIGINAKEDVINPSYLLLHLMRYKNILDAQATESAQKNINYSNLRPLPILFPTKKEEQLQITNKVIAIFSEIDSKKTKIKILEQLKKSLMQNLLTGKIKLINNNVI